MAGNWRIRHKLILGMALVLAVMGLLLFGTLNGLLTYRATMRTLDGKLPELKKANALRAQGKYAEAEKEHRAVLAIRERVLGAEHPDVFNSCFNLALCLEAQINPPSNDICASLLIRLHQTLKKSGVN